MWRVRVSVLAFLLLVAVCGCGAVDFEDCGSTIGKFSSITVSGCDDSKPLCSLVRNTNVSIDIDFSPDVDASKVTAVVHGVLMGVPMPFPLSNADACADPASKVECPIKKGVAYTYHNTLSILKQYPAVVVTVKWELENEKNEKIVCVEIPARIV